MIMLRTTRLARLFIFTALLAAGSSGAAAGEDLPFVGRYVSSPPAPHRTSRQHLLLVRGIPAEISSAANYTPAIALAGIVIAARHDPLHRKEARR